jgi:hypothetical protein
VLLREVGENTKKEKRLKEEEKEEKEEKKRLRRDFELPVDRRFFPLPAPFPVVDSFSA